MRQVSEVITWSLLSRLKPAVIGYMPNMLLGSLLVCTILKQLQFL